MTRADSRFYLPSQVSMPLRFLPYMTRNGDYICPSHIVVGLPEERGSTYLCAWGCYSTIQGLGRGDGGVPLFLLLGGDPPSSHRGVHLSREKVRLRRARHSYSYCYLFQQTWVDTSMVMENFLRWTPGNKNNFKNHVARNEAIYPEEDLSGARGAGLGDTIHLFKFRCYIFISWQPYSVSNYYIWQHYSVSKYYIYVGHCGFRR